MKLRTLMGEAIEQGIATGIRRTIKYTDEGRADVLKEVEEALSEHLEIEIWNSLDEFLEISDEQVEPEA